MAALGVLGPLLSPDGCHPQTAVVGHGGPIGVLRPGGAHSPGVPRGQCLVEKQRRGQLLRWLVEAGRCLPT